MNEDCLSLRNTNRVFFLSVAPFIDSGGVVSDDVEA
jgi:hypothetical protein